MGEEEMRCKAKGTEEQTMEKYFRDTPLFTSHCIFVASCPFNNRRKVTKTTMHSLSCEEFEPSKH
eukprot:763068-Hanusia_phi.AAC.1